MTALPALADFSSTAVMLSVRWQTKASRSATPPYGALPAYGSQEDGFRAGVIERWVERLYLNGMAENAQLEPSHQVRRFINVGQTPERRGFPLATPAHGGQVNATYRVFRGGFNEEWCDVLRWQKVDVSVVPGEHPFVQTRTAEAASAARWAELDLKIDRWSRLPDDWDGEDGICPPKDLVNAARNFLCRIRGRVPVPSSGYVAGDGEIGFRWKKDNGFASAAFLTDGHIVIFCRSPGSASALRADERYTPSLDLSALFAALQKFA